MPSLSLAVSAAPAAPAGTVADAPARLTLATPGITAVIEKTRCGCFTCAVLIHCWPKHPTTSKLARCAGCASGSKPTRRCTAPGPAPCPPTGAANYTLTATATGPGYAAAPRRRVVEYAIQRVRAAPNSVTLQGQPVPLAASAADYAALDSAASFDTSAQVVRVRFQWRHQAATVQVFGTALAAGKPAAVPTAASLNAPYPNPFSSETTFSYEVVRPGAYTLRVYALTG